MKHFNKIITLSIILMVSGAVLSCSRTKRTANVTGTKAQVTEIVNGNTIKLSNNLTVKLIGVKPTSDTKTYLENNIKGKHVKLVSDSHDTKKTYTVGGRNTVNAYVVVPSDKRMNSVNGHVIRIGMAAYDAIGGTRDSVFTENKSLTELSIQEAMAFLRPRTFMISCNDGSTGTGFYISSFGIALTNAHVMDGSNYRNAQIIPMAEDGSLDYYNYRSVNRILVYGDKYNPAMDFCIFEVDLNGQQVPFLPLREEKPTDGCGVYQLGCNLGLPAQLKDGIYSWTIDGLVYHSIMTNHGDSGSPIVDRSGQVIGVVCGGFRDPETGSATSANIGVDIQTIKRWLDEHPNQQIGVLYGH